MPNITFPYKVIDFMIFALVLLSYITLHVHYTVVC